MAHANPEDFHAALAEFVATHGEVAAILPPGRASLSFPQLLDRVVEVRITLNAL